MSPSACGGAPRPPAAGPPTALFQALPLPSIRATVYIYIYIYIHIHTYIHTYIHTLHYITLHYITLHYITLHYITLHYITLHTCTYYQNTNYILYYIHIIRILMLYIYI